MSDAIVCKLTKRIGSSICVLSKTSRSIRCNFPMCQNAFDSRSRHPFRLNSGNIIVWLSLSMVLRVLKNNLVEKCRRSKSNKLLHYLEKYSSLDVKLAVGFQIAWWTYDIKNVDLSYYFRHDCIMTNNHQFLLPWKIIRAQFPIASTPREI